MNDHIVLKSILLGRRVLTPIGPHFVDDVIVRNGEVVIEVSPMGSLGFQYNLEECTILNIEEPVTDKLKESLTDAKKALEKAINEIKHID